MREWRLRNCNNGVGHAENHYWRAFDMHTFTGGLDYDISAVEFGIDGAATRDRQQPLTVNLYPNHGSPFPNGSRTLLATSGELTFRTRQLHLRAVDCDGCCRNA